MSKVYLVAYYTVDDNPNDHVYFNRDREADKIVHAFGGTDVDRGTFLPIMKRDIQWELDLDKAREAKKALEAAGFEAEIEYVCLP